MSVGWLHAAHELVWLVVGCGRVWQGAGGVASCAGRVRRPDGPTARSRALPVRVSAPELPAGLSVEEAIRIAEAIDVTHAESTRAAYGCMWGLVGALVPGQGSGRPCPPDHRWPASRPSGIEKRPLSLGQRTILKLNIGVPKVPISRSQTGSSISAPRALDRSPRSMTSV